LDGEPTGQTGSSIAVGAGLVADSVHSLVAIAKKADIAGSAGVRFRITASTSGAGPLPVDLGMAANYVVFAETGITNVSTSSIIGNLGLSLHPTASTAIVGFEPLTVDGSGQFATSPIVNGKIYAYDYVTPTPDNINTAVLNMHSAYDDAANRTSPDFSDLGGSTISDRTFVPGLYKWSTAISIDTDLTISGGPDDVWIFQVTGGLTMTAGKTIILSGGALPEHIIWQIAGDAGVTIGASAHFKGIVLAKTAITLGNLASVNGRLFAQTAVTLSANTVQPTL
jgi:hypothetical protein